jgi:hypothetical protein
MENWLRRDYFEKRRKKRKSLRFALGNGCPLLFNIVPLISELTNRKQAAAKTTRTRSPVGEFPDQGDKVKN